ncbi:MAG: hypothetical protein KGZ42_06720 [Melioribacter sp.]|nr:hypothetical protein [Melioribacter sp.]
MKTVLMLLCMLILFSTILFPQNKDSTISKTDWGISLNTGYSSYGTGISIHKNISDNLNLEASFGVDLALIPFLGFGPASNEYLVGIGGNYFIFEKSNLAINFSSFLHIDTTTDENVIGDKRYISLATYFGYIPRLSKDIPFFLKLGINYDLKNSRKLELNLVFGLFISL